MGIAILVRTHLYIEAALRSLLRNYYCCIKIGIKAQKSFHQFWKCFWKWPLTDLGLLNQFSLFHYLPLFFKFIKTLVTYLIPCSYFTGVIIIPPEVERGGGVYWSHLVHLSIRMSLHPSIRVYVCLPLDRIVSVLYLQQYLLDPFHINTSYQTTLEGVSNILCFKFGKFCKFVTLTLSCLDLGSNMNQ